MHEAKMTDDTHCQNHPDRDVTARCVRFNRRFCDLDFEPDANDPAECLSEGTYCEYRDQCVVWEKVRRRKRRMEREGIETNGKGRGQKSKD